MNIAPVQKGVYTLGKRTDIPGMGKFDPLSQMKVNSSRARCAAVATLLSVLCVLSALRLPMRSSSVLLSRSVLLPSSASSLGGG